MFLLVTDLSLAAEPARRSAPIPVTCACPGRPRPLGKSVNCEDACFGPEAIEVYEKEAFDEADKRKEAERKLAEEAEQLEKANEARLDAEALAMVKLTDSDGDDAEDPAVHVRTTTSQVAPSDASEKETPVPQKRHKPKKHRTRRP